MTFNVLRIHSLNRAVSWVVGSVALVVLGLATQAPAQWLSPMLSRASEGQLACQRWTGSWWHARCEQLRWRDPATGQRTELGTLAWRLQHLRLWPFSLTLQGGWRRADSWLQTEGVLTPWPNNAPYWQASSLRGKLEMATLRASVPSVVWRKLGAAGNAEGTVAVQLARVSMQWGRPPCAEGNAVVLQLREPSWPSALGPLHLELSGDCPLPQGRLKDSGGPLQIDVRIYFERLNQLKLQGQISPRAQALDVWQPMLSLIGPMTAQGGYNMDLTLEWQAGAQSSDSSMNF